MEPKKKNFNYYSALKISVVYLILSSLYILLSDKIIIEFLGDSATVNILNNIQSYKGLAFVFVTSALIFVFVQREINSKEKYIKTIELQNKKLEESEYKYSNLFYSMEQGVTYQNNKGEIIDANPAAIRILGLTLDQMQGKSSLDPDWKAIHEDGSEYPGDGHPSMVALKTGKIVDNVIMGVFNPKQKDYKWIKINAFPQFRNGKSNPFQVFTTFDDITAERSIKQSLNELYSKYQNIIHTANIAIAELDSEGRYIFVNPAWEGIFGYSRNEAIGKKTDLIAISDEIDTSLFNKLKKQQITDFHEEHKYRNKKGQVILCDLHVSANHDSDGNLKSFVVVMIDITEAKESELRLKQNEEKFRNLFENSMVGKSMTSVDGMLLVNKAFSNIVGYTAEELTTINWKDITHTDDIEISEEKINTLILSKEESARWEKRYIHKNGNIVWVDINTTIQKDEKGEPLYFITAIYDITERKLAEQELKESEEKFYKIFQNSPNSIILTRVSDYEIVNANEATTLITGYSLNELIGKKQSQINIWKSVDQRRKFNDLLIKNGRVKDFEAEFVTKSGENCIWKTSGEIIQISNKKYILGIIEDINDIRKQEQEILRQSEFINAMTEYQPAGIVACDEEGKLVLFNKAAKEWHGIDVMKISQQEWAKHYGLYSADGISILETNEIPLIKAFNGEKVENFEIVIKAAGQKPRMVSCNGASFSDQTGTSLGAVIVMNDITLQKEIENDLIKSEETAHKALNKVKRSEFLLNESGRLAKVGGWQWDVQEEKLFWTDETYQIHDLEKDQNDLKSEELIQKSLECYTPEDRDIIAKAFDKCTKTGEEYEFTVPFKTAKGRNLWIRTSGQAVLENNKVITVTGLIQDITESKRIQEKIERSEFLLNEAGRMAKIGAWEFDLATQKTQWSDQVFELHAIPVAEVPDFDFIMGCYIEGSEEILRKSIEECITERKIYELELRFLNARNEKLWVRAIGYPIINDKDEIISIRGVVQDITELKESILHLEANEKSLQKAVIDLERSEFLLNETGKLSKVGGWDMDLTTMTPYFSKETYRIYGIPIGVPPKIEDGINFYAPEARPIIQKAVAEAIEKNKGYDLQVPFITAKGKRIWVRTIAQVQEKDGKAVRMFGAIQDITEQKKKENELKFSEKRFRAMIEGAPDPIFIQTNKCFAYLNKHAVNLFGAKDEKELIGKPVLDFFHPDFHKAALERIKKLNNDKTLVPEPFEQILIKLNGKEVWVETKGEPIFFNNEHGGLVFVRDISYRKKAEKELRDSEKRYKTLFENQPTIIWEEDFSDLKKQFDNLKKKGVVDFNIYFEEHPEVVKDLAAMVKVVEVNTTGIEILEAESKEDIVKNIPFYFDSEEAWLKFKDELVALAHGEVSFQCEIPIRTVKGNSKILYLKLIVHPDYTNDLKKVLVTFLDISEIKKAEKELQDSKNKLKELLDSLESGVVVHAPDTSITYHNQRAAKILRARYDELTGKQVFDYPWDFLHEDGTKLNLEDYPVSQILKRKEGIKNMVIGMSHNENKVWALLNGFPTLKENGEIKEIIISFIEITEQIKANTIIKESEAKYKLLADNITDVISLHGHDAKYEYVSPSIKKVRGYDPEELLGKNPYDFIHPDDINETINEAHTKLLEKGLPTKMVYRFKYKDGQYGWLESNRQPILDENNNILKIVSSSRDISDRIQKIEAIENYQKSLQNMTTEISLIEEKQRKEIAANIHDHLSQSLVISKIKLSDLQKDMKNSNSKKEIIQVINHISNAIENSRKITYDLSPPVLYELGLIETLYWMVEKIEEEHKLKAFFTTNIEYLNLSESKLIILYRIIQELINNIIKHAHAKKINIKLTDEKEGIQLILSDNGRGFDVNSLKETREKNTGFGLFSVRERVNNLGGKLSVESEIGTGTKIKINLPLNIK